MLLALCNFPFLAYNKDVKKRHKLSARKTLLWRGENYHEKSTLLSLATAGAIVLTSAGTYAVWDTLSGTSTGQITVANSSVTVAATNMTFVEGTDTIGEDSIAYTGTAKFEVTDAGNNVNTMTLVPTVKNGENIVNAADVDVTIKRWSSIN